MIGDWIDARSQTLINFLVSFVGGLLFLTSVDTSTEIKNVKNLSKLIEKVIIEAAFENVVQVIKNVASYVLVGKILEE